MRTMYDGIDSDAEVIPANAQLVAGYVDGDYAWTPADWARFPHSVHVGIAVSASTNAGAVLDCEKGDATPAESVTWVLTRRRSGADPTVYCNTSTWPAVRSAFQSRSVAEPHYWVASYDGNTAIPAGAVAHQYESTARWDLSSVADYWPGVDKAPAQTPPATAPASESEDDMKASEMGVNGVAMIGIAAGADTTVEIGADPGVIKPGTTWRVVALMGGKKPFEIAKGWALDADGSGTGVVHVPADLVPFSRVLVAYCSDPSLPFVMYVQ